ncbi:MAG: hypothetical protein GWO10_02545 [candidate division Zixibacteria bacterium]|nr:hypothetical protein [candidate division Zixibacteria bacterium]
MARLVQSLGAGVALYEAKSSMSPATETRLMNWYDFNLYGDPTQSIKEKEPGKSPPEHLKWSQPPIEIDPNSITPIYCGWDEPSFRETYSEEEFPCWNNQRQCHGDADNALQGSPISGFIYVGSNDMNILMAAMGTVYPDPAYNHCADFNRDYKVDDTDLQILNTWLDVKEPPQGFGVPANCPPEGNIMQQHWHVVADDFRCLGTMPITSVHWWGSYQYWDGPEPPFMVPEAWRIGFWSNMPEPAWSAGKLVHDPEGIGSPAGGWGVLEVVDNGNMANVVDAVTSLESGTGTRHVYNLFGPININDSSTPANAGNFPGDGPYGVVSAAIKPAGGVDDIAFLARGRVNIPTTGDWTFYIRSDDGEELSIDYGALVIGSEGWYDNNFGTINLTAGEHDIQVIHRERTGGANVEVAAAKGATNTLYFFRLIGSGDPGLPATSSNVPGFVFDPTFTQSNPGESGTLNNLAQAQAAITMSIGMATDVMITDDRVNHSDPDNRGLGNDVFASDHNNPWDVFWGAGTDEDDSAILVQGELWIATGGNYYIGYNSDDGAQLRIDTMGAFPWLSIFEDATGSATIASTLFPNDTLQTDVKTGKSWTVGEIFLPPGGYPFELLMFDRGGGFFVEMFGGTIPGVYDLILTGPERPIPVPEVAPALDLVRGQTPAEPDYSYPEELIWDIVVPADRVQQEFVGYDEFPDKPFDSCFQYYVDLQPDEWFPQDPYTDIHSSDPVVYYKLNGDAKDSSGNGYHGTEYGGPAYVNGVIGQAINLDGLDDYVDTGCTTDLPKWTIAAWVTSPAAPTAALPSGPVHREKNYQINWNHPDPLFRGAAGIEVGGTWYAASYGTLNANKWYHLAATYDGNVLKAYKNGDLIMSNPSPSGNPTAETASLKLGKHALSPQFFAGSIDDVRIYDQDLTQEQIKTQMIGLVAHYKLDESAGLTARDSSCHGNHATLSDGPTWQPTGGFHGGALLFDGIDDRVECGGLGISGNDTRTIGGWAKASTTAIPIWTTVFGFSNAGNVPDTYFDIERDNMGNYVLHTCYWQQVLCPVDLNWHHFAATHDGTTTAWYVDNALVGSAPKTLSTIDEVRMGMRKWNGNHFPGLIDDVAIFNSALNSAQIQTLSMMGANLFIGDPNLVALWELDESSGYTASDSSGNGNHGTLNDPPVWRPLGGMIKGALDFDGKDDFVDNGKTASQLGIGGNNPRTITAWVFTRSFIGGGIYEMGQDGSGADGQDFSLRAKWVDNNWRVQYWGATYDTDFTYTSKNKWVHFAHVHDGSYTRVYADGQEVVNVSRILNTTNNKTFRLGRWQNNYFDGLIDDVRIYNRALGTDEIKSLSGSGEDIFWLSVAAVYPDDVNIYNPWGFKTRPESWMDDAVRLDLLEQPHVGTVIDPCIVTPIEDPGTQKSFDVAFELDTDPDYIKWEQPFTGFRHWPHYEDELSRVIADPVQDLFQIDRLVADDWRCDHETPVTAAVWWGSYIGYEYYACQEQQLPAPVKPDYFSLTIWTDVPAGEDPNPDVLFSHPGKKIWEYMAYDYDEVMVGYDKYPHGTHKEPVFRYSVRLPKQAWFLQEDVNNIYWFSVAAVYKITTEPLYEWGWTNHQHFFNDDAVAGILDPAVGWFWEELYDQTENSQDMSFMLFTEPDCLNKNAVGYADWVAWGKPDCWCYQRQCRGDIDGIKTGPFWIAIPDLNTFRNCFNKFDAALPPGCICADLDHLKTGPFRVAIPDLNIFRQYFNKMEALVPICDQPPIYTGPYNFWTKP